jgi:hypothetical protein
MAGWKLRKDKASGETSGEAEALEVKPVSEDVSAGEESPNEMQWEAPKDDWIVPADPIIFAPPIIAEPAFAVPLPAESEPKIEPKPQTVTEEEALPHFEDDLLPISEVIAPPIVPIAPPTLVFPTAAPAAPGIPDVTLRMDSSELASGIPSPSGFSIPPVSPFLVVLPKEEIIETPHTLQVRIGRLSATFEITKEVMVIGRPDSELHFYPDIEIDLDDAVSRRHAEILRHEKDYYLVDAGSTNGTLLNGEMLKPHEERLLAHGDRIRVGERTEIIFE